MAGNERTYGTSSIDVSTVAAARAESLIPELLQSEFVGFHSSTPSS
jgi:hypothetical protein